MDIRNYFGAKPKNGKENGRENGSKQDSKPTGKKRPKPLVLSSDSEDESKKEEVVQKAKQAKKRAARPVLSDSDDDFATKPSSKKEASKPDLKPVDPNDFFANAKPRPKKEKAESSQKPEVKRKRKVSGDELHDDPDFEAMLKNIDEEDLVAKEKVKPSPMKKAKKEKIESAPTKIKKEDVPSQSPKKVISSPTPKTNGASKSNGSSKAKNVTPEKPKTKQIKVEKKDTKDSPKKAKTVSPKKEPEVVSKAIAPMTPAPEVPVSSQLWVDKYKPTNLKSVIGQQGDKSNMKKLLTWMRNWPKNHLFNNGKKPQRPPPFARDDDGSWAKAALLSGPPGVGKTTTSYLVAKELGLDIMELNASDTRSKKMLGSCLETALTNLSLAKESKNRVILMDEVDGMAGNEDRGGMAELIALIKNSKVPVICMCNDRNHPKIRSLANYCFDLRFQRPRVEQIKAAMMSVCFKEKIKIDPQALVEMITGCNQDIRQVLHHLSMLKGQNDKIGADQAKKEAASSKKTSIKIGPWDVVRKVFSDSEKRDMSLIDKSDLFFHDYSIGPLFVQENYLLSVPQEANHDKKKTMLLASKAADSICMGDLVEKSIRSQNAWSLLPTEAMFASVIPGEYMNGYVAGKIEFPQWLGKYSRQNKFDRILQELQVHTRLSAGLAKSSLNQDFIQHLRDNVIRPLKDNGQDGVQESVKAMEFYSLLREDLDNLLEVTSWPDKPDPMRSVETKVKAAFTRSYNKEVVLPYAKTANVTKKAKESVPAGLGEEDEVEEEEQDDTIDNDAMVKVKKRPEKKTSDKKTTDKKATEPKGKGRGKKSK